MPSSATILDTIWDVQRYVRTCAKYANENSDYVFEVHFTDLHTSPEDGHPRFYTTREGKMVQLYVPNPTSATTLRDAAVIKGITLHEMLHVVCGTMDAEDAWQASGLTALKHDSPLFHLANMLEDHRIERLDCEKFEGDRRVLTELYRYVSSEMTDKIRDGTYDLEKCSDTAKKLSGAMISDLVSREWWMNIGDVAAEQIDVSPEIVNAYSHKINDAGFTDRMAKTQSVQDVIDLAKELFEFLFEDESAEDHIKNPENQRAPEGDGGGEDGDKDGDTSGGAEAKERGGDSGRGPRSDRLSEEEMDYLKYLQNKTSAPDAGMLAHGQHVKYEDYFKSSVSHNDFVPNVVDDIAVCNFATGLLKDGVDSGSYRVVNIRDYVTDTNSRAQRELTNVFVGNDVKITQLANKLRRKLQVKSQARWIGGAVEGRLHRKSAYRAAVPTIGDGHWNREVFKRRYVDDTLDCAVTILEDFSGSMGGSKMAHAAYGGFVLSEAVGRVLGIPTQVTTFSEVSCVVTMCVIKGWDERSVPRDRYIERAAKAAGTMCQNDDGDAILWAYDDILKRKERRKIIVVLSDGSPASSRTGDCMAYTQHVVKGIEEGKRVEIYGIGINDRNVEHIYKERSVIKAPADVEKAILDVVDRKLIVVR